MSLKKINKTAQLINRSACSVAKFFGLKSLVRNKSSEKTEQHTPNFSPRSSNPFLDKKSTAYTRLKVEWKKQGLPASNQAQEWLKFRRDLFIQSGEASRIQALTNRHAGKRCFILGNGPSLNNQDLSLLKNEITFVSNWFVNANQYPSIDPKYYCISSHEMFGGWNKPNPELNPDFYISMQDKASPAHKFFSFAFRDYIRDANLFTNESVNYLLFERPKRLVDEAGEVNLDLNYHLDDGYTVIQTMCIPLALHFGCTEIYLLGCDCDYGINKVDDPKKYFYDAKLHKTATSKFESLQRIWADNGPVFKSYSILDRALGERGVKLFNATYGGRLDVLRRVDYNTLF